MAVLDCGRKAVTVTGIFGLYEGTWSGAYSRSKAAELIARAGWHPASGEEWVVSPADNGFKLKVIFNPWPTTGLDRG